MGRAPCCSKVGLHRGPWTAREDSILINYIKAHGEGHWRSLPKKAGLLRCGKSCRLRWMNYLRPDIKRGNITPDEDDLIIRLHSLLGNRWSLIAKRLPGRTDNEIKNYWNSHLSKRFAKNNNAAGTNPKCKKYSRKTSAQVKQKKENQPSANNGETTTTKTKVHLPKAIRVSPSSVALKTSTGFLNMVTQVSGHAASVADAKMADNGQDQAVASGGVGDLIYDYHDFSSQNSILTCDNLLLDEIFEEYQQLLKGDSNHVQLDSFVDSLLA